MQSYLTAWRNIIVVSPRFICRGNPLSITALQLYAIKIFLRGVIRRSRKIDAAVCLVNQIQTDHIIVPLSDQGFLTIHIDARDMSPAILFAQPQERFASIDPFPANRVAIPAFLAINPGAVVLFVQQDRAVG